MPQGTCELTKPCAVEAGRENVELSARLRVTPPLGDRPCAHDSCVLV